MTLDLFFSWQMETDLQGFNNKPFLYDCICSAIKNVENKGELAGVTITPHQGLDKIPGTPDVAQQMYEQIDKYELFVGDVTTVQKLDDSLEEWRNKESIFFRYGPNCNVYGEYNRALGKWHDAWQQVILLSNSVNKSPEQDATVVPFDTRGRRWGIDFYLPDNTDESKKKARKQLMGPLEKAIRDSAVAAIKNVRKLYEPFDTWYNVRNNGVFKKISVNKDMTNTYRSQILAGERIVSIFGNVGAEKTVLALSIFDDCKSANNCLYVDNNRDEYSDYKKVLRSIFRDKAHNQDIILIIDNCSIDVLENIVYERKSEGAGNRIIALMKEEDGNKRISNGKVSYFDVTKDFVNEMDSSLKFAGIQSIDELEYIKGFCENQTDIIKLIASEKDCLKLDQEISPKLLTDKLLNNPMPHERDIMRALSLFDCIGWKDEKSNELDFVIGNGNIIPIACDRQELIGEARAVITKNIRRGLIAERGRDITVIPKNLAYQLLREWINEVDEVRFKNILSDISNSDIKHNLFRELHDQFRGFNSQDENGRVIQELMKVGGMFDSFEVLNTNDGSLLFAGFAEIYPMDACKLLKRVLMARSIDELKDLEYGRRHLVWLLEKLAFRPTMFTDASELLLRLGLAENESIGNNATEEFTRLFSCILPATATSLDDRLAFLTKYVEYKEYRPMILKALKRALVTQDTYVMGGAETLGGVKMDYYFPKPGEAQRYISGVLELIERIFAENQDENNQVLDAIQTHFASLCYSGFADLILSTTQRIAVAMEGKWEKMQETMAFFQKKICSHLNQEYINQYEEILRLLTKDDYISRFKRVEKESRNNFSDYERSLQEQRNKYEQIASDIYKNKALTNELLKSLVSIECINSNPFGETLSRLMNKEEQVQFIKDYISIINNGGQKRIDILCNFVQGLSDSLFSEVIPILQECCVSYTLFSCIGQRNIKPSDKMFNVLRMQIENGHSTSMDYLQYWTRINQNSFTSNDYIELLTVILSYTDGFSCAIKIASFMLYSDRFYTIKEIPELITNAFVSYSGNQIDLLHIDCAMHVAQILLDKLDLKDLAIKINSAIISYAKQKQTWFSHSYEIESIYRILMTKYFDVIWPELSEVLLSDGEDYWAYYNMKNLLGVDIVNQQDPIIQEGNHFHEMLEWCDRHVDIAPARLASMIRVEKEGNFTEEAVTLIDKYADTEYLLNEIECTINSFASVGSVVPQYEYRAQLFSTMLDHKNINVRQWAQTQVNGCEYMIMKEKQREAEKL